MVSIVEMRPPVSVGRFIRKFGYNADVDAFTGPDEDVIAAGGDQYWPAAAVAAASINIASSSAADAAAGTGARNIVIQGLDADGHEQSETITLNGTTNVKPTLDYLRIFRAYVEEVGSGGVNAGNITIADGTGTFAVIPASAGQTQQATYTIPTGYRGRGLRIDVWLESKTANTVTGVFQWRKGAGYSWRTSHTFVASNSNAAHIELCTASDQYPAGSDIRLRVADASADNLAVSGEFNLYLEPI